MVLPTLPFFFIGEGRGGGAPLTIDLSQVNPAMCKCNASEQSNFNFLMNCCELFNGIYFCSKSISTFTRN